MCASPSDVDDVALVQRRGQVRAAVGQHADPVRPHAVGRGAARTPARHRPCAGPACRRAPRPAGRATASPPGRCARPPRRGSPRPPAGSPCGRRAARPRPRPPRRRSTAAGPLPGHGSAARAPPRRGDTRRCCSAAWTRPTRCWSSWLSDQSAQPAAAVGGVRARPAAMRKLDGARPPPTGLPTVSSSVAEMKDPAATAASPGCSGWPSHTPCRASLTFRFVRTRGDDRANRGRGLVEDLGVLDPGDVVEGPHGRGVACADRFKPAPRRGSPRVQRRGARTGPRTPRTGPGRLPTVPARCRPRPVPVAPAGRRAGAAAASSRGDTR